MNPADSNGALIPNYNFRAPTEDDVCGALDRVFGVERSGQLWGDACKRAGTAVGRVGSGPQFENVIRCLSAQGGAAATVARSFEIRMKTHLRLAARTAASTTGAGR